MGMSKHDITAIGVERLVSPDVGWVRKSVWAVLVFGGVVFSIIHLSHRISFYAEDPSFFSIRSKNRGRLPFPKFSLCNYITGEVRSQNRSNPNRTVNVNLRPVIKAQHTKSYAKLRLTALNASNWSWAIDCVQFNSSKQNGQPIMAFSDGWEDRLIVTIKLYPDSDNVSSVDQMYNIGGRLWIHMPFEELPDLLFRPEAHPLRPYTHTEFALHLKKVELYNDCEPINSIRDFEKYTTQRCDYRCQLQHDFNDCKYAINDLIVGGPYPRTILGPNTGVFAKRILLDAHPKKYAGYLPVYFAKSVLRTKDEGKKCLKARGLRKWRCHCPTTCSYAMYEVVRKDSPILRSFSTRIIYKFSIYFSSLRIRYEREVKAFGLFALLSDLGGCLSIWLGASLFTLLQLLDVGMLNVVKCIRRKAARQQRANQQIEGNEKPDNDNGTSHTKSWI